jgi:hypothetical protein
VIKGTSELTILPAGSYVYRSNSSEIANGNYSANVTGQTKTLTITFGNITLYLDFNGTSNANRVYTYPQAVNATGYFSGSTEGTVVLWRNGTNLGNSTSVPSIMPLGNATWNFTVSYYGQNYTVAAITYWVTVNKATSTCSVSPSTQSQTYPYSVTQYCTANYGSCNLYRNDSTAANDTAVVYGVAQYSFISNITAAQNYTSCSASSVLTISQNQTNLVNLYLNDTLNTNKSYTYPSAVNATGAAIYSNSGTVNLYRGSGSAIAGAQENIRLGNATYAYKVNVTGNQNYTSNSTGLIYYVLVNKGTIQTSLSVNPSGWTYGYPTQTNVQCSHNAVDSEVSCQLYRDDSSKGTSEQIILPVGAYLYNATAHQNGADWTNYTKNVTGQTQILTITPNITNVTLYLDFNGTANSNRVYTYPEAVNATAYFGGSNEGTVVLWRNGTSLGNTSSVNSIMPLGNATWNFTVSYYAQNYTATQITFWVSVNKGIPTLSLTGSNVTYPTAVSIQSSKVNSGDSDMNYTFWRNNTLVSSANGSAPTSDTTQLGAGWYNYVFNTSGGANYTSGSTSLGINVAQNTTNPIDIYLNNGTAYKNQNITAIYGTQTIANATMVYSNSGTANLYEDGVSVSNPQSTTLSIGVHSYKGNTSGNANYTANSTGITYYINVICKPPLSGDWTVPAGSVCTCDSEIWNVVGDAYIYGTLKLINSCNITFTLVNRNIYVYSGGNIQISPSSGFNKPS